MVFSWNILKVQNYVAIWYHSTIVVLFSTTHKGLSSFFLRKRKKHPTHLQVAAGWVHRANANISEVHSSGFRKQIFNRKKNGLNRDRNAYGNESPNWINGKINGKWANKQKMIGDESSSSPVIF